MGRYIREIAGLGAVLAVVVGLWTATAAPAPIKLGASLSLTGPYAVPAQNQHRGYQLCVKHVNEQGGVLGRQITLILLDDQSQPATAVRLYEQLISRDRVEALLGPYSSPITDAVADVSEQYKMPMVAPIAATTSIYKKGRRFVFMLESPAEVYLEGLITLAAKEGLKTVALIYEDTLFPRATVQGTIELAKKQGLQVVFVEAYPKGTTDFSALLTRVRAANPDVLGVPTYFDDAVAITRQMRGLDVYPKMYGATVGVNLPRFYELLGRNAEFVYGASQWEPELVALRAGGLIPLARQYPGAKEFVESYAQEFPGADLSYHSAAGYAGCQILTEAIKRAGTLDGEKVGEAIRQMDRHTVFGAFQVDAGGFQIAHKMLTFQWQDGKKVIVWPEELATVKPRVPMPPWSQR
jgi:branched-chain amino acid transport system substrate-binding protein